MTLILRVLLNCPLGAWDALWRFHIIRFEGPLDTSVDQRMKGSKEMLAWVNTHPDGRIVFAFGGELNDWKGTQGFEVDNFDLSTVSSRN